MAYLKIFLWGLLPVVEMRGAIPAGLLYFKLPVFWVATFSLLGSWLGGTLVLFLLSYIEPLIDRINFLKQIKEKIFRYTRAKHQKNFRKVGLALVFLLAAIPIPVLGGSYTAALVAYLFSEAKIKNLALIFAGLIIQAIIIVFVLQSRQLIF